MKKFLAGATFFMATAVFFGACTTEQKKVAPEQASQAELKEFNSANNNYKKRNTTVALKQFLGFIQRHPGTDLTDEATYDVGQIYFDQGDYFRAAKYWLSIVDGQMISKHYDQALVGAATAQSQIGHYDDALNLLGRFKITEQTDKNLAAQATELRAKLRLQKGDPVGAIADLLTAADMKTAPNDKQNLLNKAMEVTTGNLTDKQLADVISRPEFARLELPARMKLAQIHYDQKDWSTARGEFSTIISKFAGTEESKRAQNYLNVLDAQEKTDSTVIGAVLPLTGKDGQTGNKVLHGIQMGLGLFNKNAASPLKLAVVDSESNADVARRGVERLVSEDHAVAIIGDVSSKTAQAAATKAQELGIPCLTLTQKPGITEIGDFVFRNISTPEAQMRTLVDVAMGQRGFKRFAIMYPNDGYGTTYASLFWDNVMLRGGQITAAQSYDPDETDFREPVQRLVGTYYAEEDRGKELDLRMRDWQKEQIKAAAEKGQRRNPNDKPPKDILPPVVDFDAVFIPDTVKKMGQIAAMLAFNDVDKVPLLGTDLWDDPTEIVARGQKHVENSLFVEFFFADDQSAEMKKFTDEFQSEFGYKPGVFEALGYDSAHALEEILRNYSYSLSRAGLRDRLASLSNINGATGPLRMNAQREIEKTLVPLTVNGGKIVKLDTNAGTPQ